MRLPRYLVDAINALLLELDKQWLTSKAKEATIILKEVAMTGEAPDDARSA